MRQKCLHKKGEDIKKQKKFEKTDAKNYEKY